MFNRLAKAYLMTGSHFRSAALALTVAAAAPPVAAHVTIDPLEAPAHSYFKAQLRVGHGCKGSPTVRVRVRLPEGTLSVKPQPKPGWQVETTRVGSRTPVDDGHGGKITETVAGRAGASRRAPRRVRGDDAPRPPGATPLPVVQSGVDTPWIEIQD
jgi:uncharacterized protein YcnI